MALEYELTLAGTTPVNQVAERALPDPADRPTGTAPLLAAALYRRYGFEVVVLAEPDGYVEAKSDHGRWAWEPGACVSVTFRMDKFADPAWAVLNMVTIVRRVLGTGAEDAALTLNDNLLLLTRLDRTLVKHSRGEWWSSYPPADELIAG